VHFLEVVGGETLSSWWKSPVRQRSAWQIDQDRLRAGEAKGIRTAAAEKALEKMKLKATANQKTEWKSKDK
jgi:hypothetical protein